MKLEKVAASMGVGIAVSQSWLDEVRHNAELMSEACFITGKSAEEVRAAAAQSPLCFYDFVQLLKTGHKI